MIWPWFWLRHMFDPIDKLKEHLRHASVSTDSAFKEGMEGSRRFLESLFGEMGLSVEVVDTDLHPIVLAKREGSPDWPHVLIYGHYDVQPPDPLDLWNSAPFEPTEIDGRLFARGAAGEAAALPLGHYAFGHVLVRETLYGELSAPERTRLHREVGGGS